MSRNAAFPDLFDLYLRMLEEQEKKSMVYCNIVYILEMCEVSEMGKPEAWCLSLLVMFEGQADLQIGRLLFEFLKKNSVTNAICKYVEYNW